MPPPPGASLVSNDIIGHRLGKRVEQRIRSVEVDHIDTLAADVLIWIAHVGPLQYHVVRYRSDVGHIERNRIGKPKVVRDGPAGPQVSSIGRGPRYDVSADVGRRSYGATDPDVDVDVLVEDSRIRRNGGIPTVVVKQIFLDQQSPCNATDKHTSRNALVAPSVDDDVPPQQQVLRGETAVTQKS